MILQENKGGGKTFTPIEVEGTKGYTIRQVFKSPDDELSTDWDSTNRMSSITRERMKNSSSTTRGFRSVHRFQQKLRRAS